MCAVWLCGERIYVHVSSKFLCHLHLATVSSYLIWHGCCCVTIYVWFFLDSCQPLCCLLSPLTIRIPISFFFFALLSHIILLVDEFLILYSTHLGDYWSRMLWLNVCVCTNMWVCLLVYMNRVEKPPYIILFHIPLSHPPSLSVYICLYV